MATVGRNQQQRNEVTRRAGSGGTRLATATMNADIQPAKPGRPTGAWIDIYADIRLVRCHMQIDELQDIAKRVRRDIVEMITAAKSGHSGGSLAAVEIVVELYFNHMRIDPAKAKWADRDRFILSKGHAAPVLCSVMAARGYADAPKDKLNTLRQFGSVFQGHPDMRFIPSLEASTGSLGQGLSLGLEMALGARLDGRPSRFLMMLGDGEVQEGQIWEADMAAFHKADNLVAIMDYNRIQSDGFVSDIMEIALVAEKWRQFGCMNSQRSPSMGRARR